MFLKMLASLSFVLAPSAFAITDQSTKIEEVLEYGTLSRQDCERYRSGHTDRETTLRCGKYMFFYDNLGGAGLPAELVDLLRNKAPHTVGNSLEKFGYYKDPYSNAHLPVGLAPGEKIMGAVPTYNLTCASCHFTRLPDGRYVVGQPNHNLRFNHLLLVVSTLPELLADPQTPQAAEVQLVINPIVEELFGRDRSTTQGAQRSFFQFTATSITHRQATPASLKVDLALTPSGILDPLAPGGVDDKVSIPLRILPLWSIDPKEMVKSGATHGAMLTSTGGSPDLLHVMRTQRTINGLLTGKDLKAAYPDTYYQPLIEYIYQLESPRSQLTLDQTKVQAGQKLFAESCSNCHNGPGYAGTRIFDLNAIGTDHNLARQADPDMTGLAILNLFEPEEMTGGVRAPRLQAIWSYSRFLHNGSLSSLDELFCLNGPRPKPLPLAGMSTAGHDYTCEGLTKNQKLEVIEFLKSL